MVRCLLSDVFEGVAREDLPENDQAADTDYQCNHGGASAEHGDTCAPGAHGIHPDAGGEHESKQDVRFDETDDYCTEYGEQRPRQWPTLQQVVVTERERS